MNWHHCSPVPPWARGIATVVWAFAQTLKWVGPPPVSAPLAFATSPQSKFEASMRCLSSLGHWLAPGW
eukprot:7189186-Alexandrium_andersonii.AAC.1